MWFRQGVMCGVVIFLIWVGANYAVCDLLCSHFGATLALPSKPSKILKVRLAGHSQTSLYGLFFLVIVTWKSWLSGTLQIGHLLDVPPKETLPAKTTMLETLASSPHQAGPRGHQPPTTSKLVAGPCGTRNLDPFCSRLRLHKLRDKLCIPWLHMTSITI